MVESSTARTRLAVSARGRLSERLRSLRMNGIQGQSITQRQIAQALRASAPLVSSWENPMSDAVPTEERLHSYALFFATPRTVASEPARLLDQSQLTDEEELRRKNLLEELTQLRRQALGMVQRSQSFWSFRDDQPIRIISNVLATGGISSEYADPWHPNHSAAMRYSDIDAMLELYGHIRAANPESDVKCLGEDEVSPTTFASHVIMLGGGDDPAALSVERRHEMAPMSYYRRRLDLPVSVDLPEDGDPHYDREYVVQVDEDGSPGYRAPERKTYPPSYLLDSSGHRRMGITGRPMLEYDVALIARRQNEMNLSTTVTICSGLFTRGTYGAVRAFTDPSFTEQNQQRLAQLVNPDRFWMLIHVPVFQGRDGLQTLTPDLTRPAHVLMYE